LKLNTLLPGLRARGTSGCLLIAFLSAALWARWADGAEVAFAEHSISTYASFAMCVFATDVDGDGDTDVLLANGTRLGDIMYWFENDGSSLPSFTGHVIPTTQISAGSIFGEDLDGDSDVDVLSASWIDDTITWYENDGSSPPSFTERVISTNADYAYSVFAADVDGDGNTDVLSASYGDDKIAWYENDGSLPPSFTERVISSAAGGAQCVFAADLDGDIDTDVLSACGSADKIAWYENAGGTPPSFTEHVISSTVDWPISVFAKDLDGDDDTDVLSALPRADKIAWYENDGGSPPSFTQRIISINADNALSVFAADVDGDGDMDALSASFDDDKIAWYENEGGSPPSFAERVISSSTDGARSVFAADMDADGDTDVLSGSNLDSKVAWYENLGTSSPSFTILDAGSNPVLRILGTGHTLLKGTLNSGLGSISPTGGGEILVKDRSGQIAARVDLTTGDLELRGSITTRQSGITPTSGSDFVVKDVRGNVVAYISAAGDMVTKGDVHENFVFP